MRPSSSTSSNSRKSGLRWTRYLACILVLAFVWNIQYIYNLLEPRKGIRFSADDPLDVVTRQSARPRQRDDDADAHENLDQQDSQTQQMYAYDREPLSTVNISSDIALDAIGRAKSDACRRRLIEAAYQREHTPDVLTPKRLPRTCPLADGTKRGKYVGCYSDHPKDRLLKVGEFNLKETNSIDNCILHCIRVGQELAGVQYGSECFCGSKRVLKKTVRLTNDLGCQAYRCPGNETEFCGGYKMLAIYETGVGKKAPVNVRHVKDDEMLDGAPVVKIVFLLQLNGRSTRQVRRMLKLLYRRKHFYYVHVDERQSYMYREMLELERILPNLKVKRKRFSSIWGGASLLSMMIDAFKDLLDEFRFWPWDYVINLSEADMPLVGVDTVERLLRKYRGTNFMRSHGNGTASFIRKQGLDQLFVECDHHMYRLGKRKLPEQIRFDGGSDWFALHRSLIQYAIRAPEKPDENPMAAGLARMYETVLLPAESFFHTLALNSPFCTTMADTNLKLTNWKRKQGCKCQYRHIVDWCGCSPNVITMDEWEQLREPEILHQLDYFARKFDAIIDQNVIRKVERQILKQEARMETVIREAAAADAAPPRPKEDGESTTTTRATAVKLTVDQRDELPGFHSYWENQYDVLDESMDQLRKTEYATWLLLRSLRRLAVGRLFERSFNSADDREAAACRQRCVGDRTGSIERMHVYHEANVFGGLLLQFNGTCGGDGGNGVPWSLEAYVKRITDTTRHRQEGNQLAMALLGLEVGTKFDVKEEIFRNYAGAMSVDGAFAIRHQWDLSLLQDIPKSERKVDIIFLDPDGANRGAYVQKLTNPTGFEYTKLPITKDHELEPGVWRVQLRSQNTIIAETSFPLLPADGGKSSTENASYVDQLVSRYYRIEDTCRADRIVVGSSPESIKRRSAITNRCDKLFLLNDEEGRLQDSERPPGDSPTPLCRRTHWSSRSPDPKSEINGFDWKTGAILPRSWCRGSIYSKTLSWLDCERRMMWRLITGGH